MSLKMLVLPQLAVLHLHWLHRLYFPSWSVKVWPPNLKDTLSHLQKPATNGSDFMCSLLITFLQTIFKSLRFSYLLRFSSSWSRWCLRSALRCQFSSHMARWSRSFSSWWIRSSNILQTFGYNNQRDFNNFPSNPSNKQTVVQFWDCICWNDKN